MGLQSCSDPSSSPSTGAGGLKGATRQAPWHHGHQPTPAQRGHANGWKPGAFGVPQAPQTSVPALCAPPQRSASRTKRDVSPPTSCPGTNPPAMGSLGMPPAPWDARLLLRRAAGELHPACQDLGHTGPRKKWPAGMELGQSRGSPAPNQQNPPQNHRPALQAQLRAILPLSGRVTALPLCFNRIWGLGLHHLDLCLWVFSEGKYLKKKKKKWAHN